MKLTRTHLQNMIREAVADAKKKTSKRRSIREAMTQEVGGALSDLDPSDLIDFADAYIRLGKDGRRVLKMLVDDPTSVGDDAEVEVDDIEMELGTMNSMIADAVAEWRSREPQVEPPV